MAHHEVGTCIAGFLARRWLGASWAVRPRVDVLGELAGSETGEDPRRTVGWEGANLTEGLMGISIPLSRAGIRDARNVGDGRLLVSSFQPISNLIPIFLEMRKPFPLGIDHGSRGRAIYQAVLNQCFERHPVHFVSIAVLGEL